MKTSELIRKGADEIRRRGWTQGDYGDDPDRPSDCRVCLAGALNAVACGDPYAGPGYNDAPEAVAAWPYFIEATGDRWIANWNDIDGRTVEEVLAAFEKAAEFAERMGD